MSLLGKGKSDDNHSVPNLKPVLGFRDLVFFYVVGIFGIRLLPAAAAAGPSIVVFIIISMVIFFIPGALTVTDLAKRYPEEGGLYVWSKKAFGDFHGFVTAWTYWTANLAFFPSILMFTSNQVVYIVPGSEHLGDNHLFISLLSIGIILVILALNIVGMKQSTVLNNISAYSRYIAVFILLAVGLTSWILFGSATDLEFSNWVPKMGSIRDFVFLSTIVYMFAGMEGASLLGGEVKDAKKNIPRAIVISGIIISVMYLFSSFSLLLSVSPDQLSGLTGINDAIKVGINNIGGERLALIATSVFSIIIVIQMLGSLNVWLAATARLPFVMGLDRYLPPAFGKLHSRYGTPYVSLIALVAMTIFFIVLSGLGEKAGQVYKILISLEIVTFMIPYLYMFASVIKFEIDKKYRGKVHLPGGQKNALAAGIVGFIVVAASVILALVPGDDVENPTKFYLTIIASLSLNLGAGIGLYLYAKRKREKK